MSGRIAGTMSILRILTATGRGFIPGRLAVGVPVASAVDVYPACTPAVWPACTPAVWPKPHGLASAACSGADFSP